MAFVDQSKGSCNLMCLVSCAPFQRKLLDLDYLMNLVPMFCQNLPEKKQPKPDGMYVIKFLFGNNKVAKHCHCAVVVFCSLNRKNKEKRVLLWCWTMQCTRIFHGNMCLVFHNGWADKHFRLSPIHKKFVWNWIHTFIIPGCLTHGRCCFWRTPVGTRARKFRLPDTKEELEVIVHAIGMSKVNLFLLSGGSTMLKTTLSVPFNHWLWHLFLNGRKNSKTQWNWQPALWKMNASGLYQESTWKWYVWFDKYYSDFERHQG